MKKLRLLLTSAYIVAIAGMLLFSCKSEGDPIGSEDDFSLSVIPNVSIVTFSSDGYTLFADNGEIVPQTFSVETNSPLWNVESDQPWCKVTKNKRNNTFVISTSLFEPDTPPQPARVKVFSDENNFVEITVSQNKAVTIYTAGWVQTWPVYGAYWINDTGPFLLYVKGYSTYAKSICVVDGVIYIAGNAYSGDYNYVNMSQNRVGVLWVKRPEQHPLEMSYTLLSDGANDVVVSEISFYDGDVYISGWEIFSENISQAKYWKNDQEINLTDEFNDAYANSICVVNGDVYVGGCYNGNAVYWKNGSLNILNTRVGQDKSSVYSIFVTQENDVYAAGWVSRNGIYYAVYWKNGQEIQLTEEIDSCYSYIESIFVSRDNKIYAAFQNNRDDLYVGYSWSDGTIKKLFESNNKTLVGDIHVADNDIYIAGSENNGVYTYPKYWRNGRSVMLLNSFENGVASSIFVVE